MLVLVPLGIQRQRLRAVHVLLEWIRQCEFSRDVIREYPDTFASVLFAVSREAIAAALAFYSDDGTFLYILVPCSRLIGVQYRLGCINTCGVLLID